MLIAQLSVAGEGDLYPLPPSDDSVDIDQTALDEFLAGQSNLPWVVFRAAHRAASFPALLLALAPCWLHLHAPLTPTDRTPPYSPVVSS